MPIAVSSGGAVSTVYGLSPACGVSNKYNTSTVCCVPGTVEILSTGRNPVSLLLPKRDLGFFFFMCVYIYFKGIPGDGHF